jgi:hypothetical protein
MSAKRLGAAIAVVALLATGCGRLNDDGTGSDGPSAIDHPTGAGDLVLRVELTGGFVPYEYTLSNVPSWSLFGDGTLIVQGPQIEIYPQPALPNLLAISISEDGVQAILEAARKAGLTDGDASYGNECVADAATTVFTVNADGTTSVVSAYALDLGDQPGTCDGSNDAARAKLVAFQTELGDLNGWLPAGSVGPERPYEPSEVRVYVLPYRSEPDLAQPEVEWPLTPALDEFGEPVPDAPSNIGCGVVDGADLATVLPAARRANGLTPWTSGGARHLLVFRPLLPDEHSC